LHSKLEKEREQEQEDIRDPTNKLAEKRRYKGKRTIGGGAIALDIIIPTPSNTARRQAHPIAEFLIDLAPPLTANEPPVKNPAIIALPN